MAGGAGPARRRLEAALVLAAAVRLDSGDHTAAETRLLVNLGDYERAKAALPAPVPGLDELAADLDAPLAAAQAV